MSGQGDAATELGPPGELIALRYSPWSEKARWALDWHGAPYRERAYQPMFGEPWLRARARRWRGKISVPVLRCRSGYIFDSFAIAQWADEWGAGPKLIPAGQEQAVDAWNGHSETALAAGRGLLVYRTGQNPAAQRDYLPRFLPRWATDRFGRALAHSGLAFFRYKYKLDAVGQADCRQRLVETLETLARALAGGRFLLGQFSFADIAMAQVLQFVEPVAGAPIRVGAASRACWGDAELAGRFAELVAWRDALYADFRERSRHGLDSHH